MVIQCIRTSQGMANRARDQRHSLNPLLPWRLTSKYPFRRSDIFCRDAIVFDVLIYQAIFGLRAVVCHFNLVVYHICKSTR